MTKISLDQSPASYFADFVVWPLAILASLLTLLLKAPHLSVSMVVAAVLGFFSWTLIEYILHRFMLHHLQPFKGWHDEHHARPFALIGTPTAISLALFIVVGYLPLALALGPWVGLAAILGIASGYFLYIVVHHATHHWRARPGSWMAKRKREHALHHMKGVSGWYGVTTSFWDHVFKTDHR